MDNLLRRLVVPPGKKISRFVHRGSVAADIGCGPGYFTIATAEPIGPTGIVYAVDSDLKSIRAVIEKSKARGLEKVIEPHIASAAELSLMVVFPLLSGTP